MSRHGEWRAYDEFGDTLTRYQYLRARSEAPRRAPSPRHIVINRDAPFYALVELVDRYSNQHSNRRRDGVKGETCSDPCVDMA